MKIFILKLRQLKACFVSIKWIAFESVLLKEVPNQKKCHYQFFNLTNRQLWISTYYLSRSDLTHLETLLPLIRRRFFRIPIGRIYQELTAKINHMEEEVSRDKLIFQW